MESPYSEGLRCGRGRAIVCPYMHLKPLLPECACWECTHLLVSSSAPSGFHAALWMSPWKIVPFHLDTLDLNGKNKVAFSP